MAKRIHPSSLSRGPGRVQEPGRRGRARRSRTSVHTATSEAPAADEALLKILRSRVTEQDTGGFTILDFLYATGSPVDALLYSRLFWPELLEVDGAILLASSVEDEADLTLARASVRERGPRETERRFNLREFSDLFGNGLAEIDDEQAEDLAARLAVMWRCRLNDGFPERRFTVEILSADETGGDIGICFHQS